MASLYIGPKKGRLFGVKVNPKPRTLKSPRFADLRPQPPHPAPLPQARRPLGRISNPGGERERERERDIYIYVYFYLFIYLFIYVFIQLYLFMSKCVSLYMSIYIYMYVCILYTLQTR